ncbi:hypothetical protein SRB5_35600 [Streptomyces sp. RB5]|uniref:Uncharacterized protein n=1 Tax=Streptomyces smaragdinus TaxID=2585196 RepID=A0A7K0CK75_9ACTN|nr:hypothetical protein [Streptomyces smaragdinus]MQY13412.1 hypothetical protein [Streptomyces smaragdinus]
MTATGRTLPVRDPKETEQQVHAYSSRVLDALGVAGRLGHSDYTQPVDGGPHGADVYAVTHFWQLDAVPAADHAGAVRRVRQYALNLGWRLLVDRADVPGAPEVRARGDADGFTVHVVGIGTDDRIGIDVTSPYCRIPPTTG